MPYHYHYSKMYIDKPLTIEHFHFGSLEDATEIYAEAIELRIWVIEHASIVF